MASYQLTNYACVLGYAHENRKQTAMSSPSLDFIFTDGSMRPGEVFQCLSQHGPLITSSLSISFTVIFFFCQRFLLSANENRSFNLLHNAVK